MEVGRIKAVITAEDGDFNKKMAAAGQTFEVTARKLDAAGQRLADSLKKTYSERIVAANTTASREIEAAQRSMRERIRLTQNSAEVAAVRQQFNQRVEAARDGARREIQAAQSQYLAASQGLRPVITAVDQMTATTTIATSQFSKLRTATVAVASAAAGANPIFAQTSAVIGAMVGAGGVVALAVAAITALGFAYNRATKEARALKDEQKKLNDQLERGGRQRAGLTAGAENQAGAAAQKRMAEITEQLAILRTPQFRDVIDPKTGLVIARERLNVDGQILKLSKEYAELALIALEVDGKRADEATKLADESLRTNEAFDRLIESGRELDREMAEILRKAREITDEIALGFQLDERLRGVTGRPGVVPIGKPSANVVGRGAGMIGTSLGRLNAMREERAGESGGSIGQMLASQFSTKRIISNVVSGGVSAMIGAATDFATGLLTHAKRAKEALRLHMEAVNDWDRSMRSAIASLRGETEKARTFAAIDELTERIRQMGETFGVDFGVIPVFDTMDELIEWLKKQQALIASLSQAFPFLNGDELNRRLQELIDYAKELGISLDKTAATANKVSESLTNVPQGFKVALARFNATSTGMQLPDWARGAHGFSGGTQPQTSARTIVIQHIDVHGVEDVPDLVEKIEVEVARKVARGGTSLTLGWL